MAGLRASAGLTLLDAGIKSGLSESAVWKIEHEKPVRWESVHAAATTYCLKPSDDVYQTIHHLWLQQRNQLSENKPDGTGKRLLSKHGVEASRKFRILIRSLDPEQTKKVLAAAVRAAGKITPLK